MTAATYVRNLAIFMSFLIVMLPVCFADTINLFYDANGNVIQENINGNPHIKREYDGLNQLVAVRNATNNNYIEKYTHHPLQERIWIKEIYNSSGNLKETVYYLSKEFVRTVNASSGATKDYTYVWMDGQLVAQVNPDNSTYYILGDNLGSTSVVTNGSGNVIENISYNPDGDFIEGGDATRYGYEGKEKSSVLGDIDFNFRKYDPKIRIFLQPDDRIPNPYNPQYLNRYMFELGNSYKYIDKSGHFVEWLIGISIVATIISVSNIFEYSSLIEINTDWNLEQELYEAQRKAKQSFFPEWGLSKGIGALYGTVSSALGIAGATTVSVGLTIGSSSEISDYRREVALANPFAYKEYLDKRAAQMHFSSESEMEKFYSPGGVNLISLCSSLNHAYNNVNNPSHLSSIEQSMKSTAGSGKDVNWYYRKDEKGKTIYTYWVGKGGPNKSKGYKPVK